MLDLQLYRICFSTIFLADNAVCACNAYLYGYILSVLFQQGSASFIRLPFAKKSTLVVKPPMKSFGIVSIDNNGFRCLSCKEIRYSCHHVCCLQSYLESNTSSIPDFLIEIVEANQVIQTCARTIYTLTAVSNRNIPIMVLISQRSIFTGFLNDAVDLSRNAISRIIPDFASESCPYCSNEFSPDAQWSCNKKLYTQKLILDVSGRGAIHSFRT